MTAALSNIAAIVQKEWRHYFGSPIAYVALFVWTLLFGIFFYFAFSFFLRQSMAMAQQMEFGGGPKLSLNEYLIRPVMHNMAVVALFLTGVHFPRFFDTSHTVIWQTVVILFSVLLWLFWANRFTAPRQPSQPAV